jgi:hypothetical protein
MSAAPKMPESWAPRPTLFALTEEMHALDELLTASGGELTDDIEAMLATIGSQITQKVDSLAWVIRTCEARAAGFKKMRQEMDEKKTTEENKIDRLKEYVRVCLDRLGTDKIKGEQYTFALQRNGGKPPVKLLEPYASDPDLLPRDLTRITVTPDMDRIRELPTPSEFYEVLPVGTHVRIR